MGHFHPLSKGYRARSRDILHDAISLYLSKVKGFYLIIFDTFVETGGACRLLFLRNLNRDRPYIVITTRTRYIIKHVTRWGYCENNLVARAALCNMRARHTDVSIIPTFSSETTVSIGLPHAHGAAQVQFRVFTPLLTTITMRMRARSVAAGFRRRCVYAAFMMITCCAKWVLPANDDHEVRECAYTATVNYCALANAGQ